MRIIHVNKAANRHLVIKNRCQLAAYSCCIGSLLLCRQKLEQKNTEMLPYKLSAKCSVRTGITYPYGRDQSPCRESHNASQ